MSRHAYGGKRHARRAPRWPAVVHNTGSSKCDNCLRMYEAHAEGKCLFAPTAYRCDGRALTLMGRPDSKGWGVQVWVYFDGRVEANGTTRQHLYEARDLLRWYITSSHGTVTPVVHAAAKEMQRRCNSSL